MNVKRYDDIFEEFKLYHPYMIDDVDDYSPRGEFGIRIVTRNGVQYDYHTMSKTIRRVDDRPMHDLDDLNEQSWRSVFSDRLNEMMGIRGYSQRTLADSTGLSQGTISSYTNKRATPSAYALAKIARVLNCSVMDLVE